MSPPSPPPTILKHSGMEASVAHSDQSTEFITVVDSDQWGGIELLPAIATPKLPAFRYTNSK